MPENPDICALCGLPNRNRAISATYNGKTYFFCCSGCRQVFAMLMDSAETDDPAEFKKSPLFHKCREMGIIPRTEADLDVKSEPPQTAPPPEPESDSVLDLSFVVKGMWCPACAWVIEESLKKRPGILQADCNFATDRVRCRYDPVSARPHDIMRAITDLGYRVAQPGEEIQALLNRDEAIRLAICAFLTMNIMMLSFALYSGFFSTLSQSAIAKISWPAGIMAAVVIFYGGGRILQRAWRGVVSAAPGMEILISVGALSAFGFSAVNLVRGSLYLYFDTAAMLITLVQLGKLLEQRALSAVQKDLESFFEIVPRKVKICTPLKPQGVWVDIGQLAQGDIFRVDAGERIAADGIVVAGTGAADESMLTGEATPVSVGPDQGVKSGTRLVEGDLTVRAEKIGPDTLLGQMLGIMERGLSRKTPLEGKTDRILRWFVPVVIGLAAATGIACFIAGLSGSQAMVRGVTVLVIACPCALGVAIPLARVAGISLARRDGTLIRDVSAFEQASKADTFVFDKTGTITEGRWALQKTVAWTPLSETEVLALAAGLEKDSRHPIGHEIARKANRLGIEPTRSENIAVSQNGITGTYQNADVRIGGLDYIGPNNSIPDPLAAAAQKAAAQACSTVWLAYDGRPAGLFIFGDRLKANAAETVARLKSLGHTVILISGDGPEATSALARLTGIETAAGGLLPADKAAYIRTLQAREKRVAMVGDGVNDAPALACADLGIAVYAGSNLGKEIAQITLMRGDPAQLISFLSLSGRVQHTVNQNLIFSLIYNTLSIPIAMSGLLNPLIAVSAMLMSSLSVIGNTLRLSRKAKKEG